MDLITNIEHKANTSVKVNGNVYEIDSDYIIRNVKKEDAEKLLQNPTWSVLTKEMEADIKDFRAEQEKQTTERAKRVTDGPPLVTDEEILKQVEEDEAANFMPNESWTVEELKDKADEFGLEYKSNISKKKLLKLVLDWME